MTTTTILLTISQSKPVADLPDKVAGRAYTIDGVEDVKAELVADVQAVDLVRLPVKEMRHDPQPYSLDGSPIKVNHE